MTLFTLTGIRLRMGIGKLFVGGLLLSGSLSGCHLLPCCMGTGLDHNHDKCATITPGSLPEPNGTFVHRFQDIQTMKADMANFVFFLNEWRETTLSPYGDRHIGKVADRLPTVPYPVLIEPSGDKQLDEARRGVLIGILKSRNIADAPARVIIAYPDVEGLDGNEAERTYLQYLQNYGSSNRGLLQGGAGRFGLGGYGGFGGMGGRPFGY